ncbi:B-block binding subunit of TFIIIC [Corchorus olitorius]|uniref:B-block binding subunit of TFIIIC n=1 Tax=Corchorus olitorius TaxID=93759 RepID=A0A1R3H775_9ROSI|nr:B-block binding subunit of TFIIIC [Corchorus olitorius]
MEGNKTFYVVKKLEKSGLIVRQEAVERTRATGNQGQSTRLIHLRRYAKNLGSQQKFEITKEEETMGNADSQIKKIKEDVLVKDYVPSMKAICDKLEEANGKVLVISDIKHDLGYGGSRPKHRNWKNICGRLINAGVVEETYVKVNGKDELCLHLLKKFSPIDFEQKTIKYVEGNELKFGRCQRANQLVELPIDHQIYDAIDAAGFEGMLIKEVSQRFGLDQKTSLKNCSTMSNKFGMHMQRELHNKTCEYRIRTARNCESSNEIPSGSKDLSSKSSSLFVVNPGFSEGPAQLHLWNSEIDTLGKANNWEAERELSCFSPKGSEASGIITNNCESQELIHGAEKQFTNTGLHSVNTARMALKPCPALTVDSFRREQRILEWLQVEKIVLKAELYRWLVNLEKDKGTTMDRKTVDRILHKLENQGQCRCILLAINELMNTDGNRKVKVVLHPSIQSLSSEILGRIRDRLISFEKQTHGQASFRKKNINSVLVLDHVQRTITRNGSHAFALRMAAMRANGFTSGKMVRAKLLHSFLWEYACGSSSKDGVSSYGKQDHDIQNPHVTCNMFDVEAAIKSIPLELFLQVVGSTVKVDNMMEMFKNGVRLAVEGIILAYLLV